jgi:hypothetical protein
MGVWGQPVRVQFVDGYEEAWVQTIGDRTEALERGHEAMQRKLLEFRAGGDRAEALGQALRLAPKEDLAELALEAERSVMEAQIHRTRPNPVKPRRDVDAVESEANFARRMAAYQETCQRLADERKAARQERWERRREELLALEKAELAALAQPRRIDVECWNAFARTCDDWVLLRAVRQTEDHLQPYFADIGEVQALHPAVKEQLRRAYQELEPRDEDELPKLSAAIPVSV